MIGILFQKSLTIVAIEKCFVPANQVSSISEHVCKALESEKGQVLKEILICFMEKSGSGEQEVLKGIQRVFVLKLAAPLSPNSVSDHEFKKGGIYFKSSILDYFLS